MIVARTIEFDAGHRVARHESKCRNPHGHRYVVTVAVEGPVRDDDTAEQGMVVDFGRLASFLREQVHDRFDHAFIVDTDDDEMCEALMGHEWRIVLVPGTPTAENLAAWIAGWACAEFVDDPFHVVEVTVMETINSQASWTAN